MVYTSFELIYLIFDLKLFIIDFLMSEIKLPSITIETSTVYLYLLYVGIFHFHLFHLQFNYPNLVVLVLTLSEINLNYLVYECFLHIKFMLKYQYEGVYMSLISYTRNSTYETEPRLSLLIPVVHLLSIVLTKNTGYIHCL